MGFESNRFYQGFVLVAATAAIFSYQPSARSEGMSLESAGVRFGFSTHGDFNQGEALLNWNLPWHWSWQSGLRLQTKLEASAGWFEGHYETAALGTAGPNLLFHYKELPLSLEAGSSPTLLSRNIFGSKDIGSSFQFTTHIGLNWEIAQRLRLGYRFSHMSNAGIDSNHNDGINMHMVLLSYLF
jgi:hypothetical protein